MPSTMPTLLCVGCADPVRTILPRDREFDEPTLAADEINGSGDRGPVPGQQS
jgi:hypothetical protein